MLLSRTREGSVRLEEAESEGVGPREDCRASLFQREDMGSEVAGPPNDGA